MTPDIIQALVQEIYDDSENESQKLIDYYAAGDDTVRGVIDCTLMYLCGWTLDSLVHIAERNDMYVEG